jgi:O-antigen/teichoic acid export membrane protein
MAVLALFGLGDALVYFGAKSRDSPAKLIASACSLALVIGALLIVPAYFLMPLALNTQGAETVRSARHYLLIVPVFAIAALPYHILRGREEFLYWNMVRIMPNVLWLGVLLAALAFGEASPNALAQSYLAALFILGVFVAAVITHHVGGPFVPSFKRQIELARFGATSLASGAPNILAGRLDQMLLVAFFSPTVLGLYVVALGWASIVTPLLNALGSATFPRLAESPGESLRNRRFSRVCRTSVIVAAVSATVASAAAPIVVPYIFGSAFTSAVAAASILPFAVAMSGVMSVTEEGLRGSGRPGAVLIGQAVSMSVTAVALLILLPRWGVNGAAVALLFGSCAGMLAAVRVASRLSRQGVADFLIPTAADVRSAVNPMAAVASKVRVWRT